MKERELPEWLQREADDVRAEKRAVLRLRWIIVAVVLSSFVVAGVALWYS